MGFLDDVTSVVNRGTAAAERTGRTARLKLQLNELTRQRHEFETQLGASLYYATKDNPSFTEGREALYDGIAGIDAQRAQIEQEIQAIEAQAEAAQVATRQAAAYYTCPKCGTRVSAQYAFCSGCGLPIAEVIAATQNVPAAPPVVEGPTCRFCGAPMQEGDKFCMSCGKRQDAVASEE